MNTPIYNGSILSGGTARRCLALALGILLLTAGNAQSAPNPSRTKRTASRATHKGAHRKARMRVPMMQSVRQVQARIALAEAQAGRERSVETPHDPAGAAETGIEHEGATEAGRKAAAKGGAQRKRAERESEAGTDYLESYLYYLRQRAYPGDRIDPNAERRAIQHRDQMPVAGSIGHAANGGGHALSIHGAPGGGGRQRPSVGAPNQWQFLGPANLIVPYQQYYGTGPISGRINAVAYDTTHPGTYYIAAATGGVWKTTDSGASWTPLSDGWSELPVSSLAIDPTNTSVIYAGTGDYDGYKGVGHSTIATPGVERKRG